MPCHFFAECPCGFQLTFVSIMVPSGRVRHTEKRACTGRSRLIEFQLGDGEDDLAEVLIVFEVVVCHDAIAKGPNLVHDGFQASLLYQLQDGA